MAEIEEEKIRQNICKKCNKRKYCDTDCMKVALAIDKAKLKKQQYIFVARDKDICGGLSYIISFVKMKKYYRLNTKYFYWSNESVCHYSLDRSPIKGLTLKKGKQVRIPILVDKAEVVG